MNRIEKPVMIVCTGRSGSTMFYRILAQHKDLGWLSTYQQVFPKLTWLALFSNLYHWPIFDKIKEERYFPKPFSPYKFWEQYVPGIRRHDRPLYAEDVPPESIEPLRRAVAKILKYQNKPRLLFKVTGWARMALFERIFPGIRFIYIRRNPVSVVTSWVNAGWLNVTGAIDSEEWEWGEVPPRYRQIWKELGGGPLLSAAIKTQLDIDDIRNNIARFPDRCYEIDYEVFTTQPKKYLREILDFCELEWYDEFEKVIDSTKILNLSDKWKKYLTEEEGKLLMQFYDRVNSDSEVSEFA
ncbi:MAG: sulfotransferase [bacterium]